MWILIFLPYSSASVFDEVIPSTEYITTIKYFSFAQTKVTQTCVYLFLLRHCVIVESTYKLVRMSERHLNHMIKGTLRNTDTMTVCHFKTIVYESAHTSAMGDFWNARCHWLKNPLFSGMRVCSEVQHIGNFSLPKLCCAVAELSVPPCLSWIFMMQPQFVFPLCSPFSTKRGWVAKWPGNAN